MDMKKIMGEALTWEQFGTLRSNFDALVLSPMDGTEKVKMLVTILATIGDFDDETSHCMEKTIWRVTLQELAKTQPMAAEALKTEGVEFSRWFA